MMGDTLTPEEVDRKYPGGKVEWYKNAHPRHKVRISQAFYMAKHAVTAGDFRRFTEATGYETTAEKEGTSYGWDKEQFTWDLVKGLNWHNPGIEQNSNHPVVHVSYFDAMAYIDWLNQQADTSDCHGRYVLPTEAQWEYACRAGTTTEFFWGNDAAHGKGYINAADEAGTPWGTKWNYVFPFNSGYTGTAPIGSFRPNAWGLYDMLGNVWEWCNDWYGEYPTNMETDPKGPGSGSYRVNRGGSWYYLACYCRSAFRYWDDPGLRNYRLGFRLAFSSASR